MKNIQSGKWNVDNLADVATFGRKFGEMTKVGHYNLYLLITSLDHICITISMLYYLGFPHNTFYICMHVFKYRMSQLLRDRNNTFLYHVLDAFLLDFCFFLTSLFLRIDYSDLTISYFHFWPKFINFKLTIMEPYLQKVYEASNFIFMLILMGTCVASKKKKKKNWLLPITT